MDGVITFDGARGAPLAPITLQKKIEENFSCRRCNECCKKPGYVYLNSGEEEKIAAHLKMSAFDFVNQYCDLVERRRLVLKKLPNEHCIFLDEQGCKIHPAKPAQCQDFPVRWRTSQSFDYCEGLKKIV